MIRTATQDPSALFAALADRTRLRLLHLLGPGERCVCDLVDGVEAPQPTVSRHLAALRRAGLVRARRDGLWMHYRIEEGAEELLTRVFEVLRDCAAECPELGMDEIRVRASRRARGCCD
jgi:ArsR family transcriptional regulator